MQEGRVLKAKPGFQLPSASEENLELGPLFPLHDPDSLLETPR